MSTTPTHDFEVAFGETFQEIVRWGTDVYTSKAITGITKATPAVVTAVGHGLQTGWAAAVVSPGGMRQIAAEAFPPRGRDWHPVTRLTDDTLALDDVDSANMTAYTSGGTLVYATPVDLSGITAASMVIRDTPDTGTALTTLSLASGITLDTVLNTITLSFETAALTWTTGYYNLQLTDSGGITTELLTGLVLIT